MIEQLPKLPAETEESLENPKIQSDYELYASPELKMAVNKVIELLPIEQRERGTLVLQQTLNLIGAQALIEFIKNENPATEPAAHLVIENLALFIAGKPERMQAMSGRSLQYLKDTYPQIMVTPNVINAASQFAANASGEVKSPTAAQIIEAGNQFSPATTTTQPDELQKAA